MSTKLRCWWGLTGRFRPVLLGGLVAAVLVCPSEARRAVAEPTSPQASQTLLDTALRYELAGLNVHRNRVLSRALKETPDSAPARWHTGHVRFAGRWVHVDKVPELTRNDHRYREYLRLRPQSADTAADHRKLGIWCDRRRLQQPARAHFLRVIEMSPDDRLARERLGYRRVADTWLTPHELSRLNARARQMEQDRSHWEPKLVRIHHGLQRRSEKERAQARARCLAIDDPAAIPVLESVLARWSKKEALLVVETLGNITDPEASQALGRQAVSSKWETVRRAAAEKLRYRPMEAFVPAMLAAMVTPVESRDEFEHRSDGSLLHRQTLWRESRATKQEAVIETTYRVPLAWAEAAAKTRSQQRLDSAANSDVRSVELNGRICSALNVVTGEELPERPEAWWNWWDEYNETLAEEKPVQRTYNGEVYRPPQYHSCFSAGTQVWTIEGPKPIERLRGGELVLSQHPETAELAYKAVIRTTVGPTLELMRVVVGNETIDCTGGHLFWVAGGGWVRARQLATGDALHGVAGAARVGAVETGPTDKAYNLVVADFNTYFVGREKVLVHDVTAHQPTTTVVPGLKP